MNNINIPRYCNGNLVYDEIPMNSIITTSTLGYSYINSNNNGILVKNNNDISFKEFDGILYYDNNLLKSYELTANNLLCTDGAGTLSQINIGGGVLNTYKFDQNSVDTSNQDPSFTNKIVLNDCEIVDESNQRINKNYLIYGNSSKHGLSPIELDTPSNNYEYYYIVNDKNNNVNVSTASQIYTDLYNTVVNQESIQVPTISAIPICKSNETNQQLALIIPKMFDNGDYFININSDKTKFSLKNITGSILPSSLYSDDIKDFNYRKYNIYTATSNKNEFTLVKSSSTQLNEPYLSGYGWKDLTTTTFLNSNNLSITKSLIYSNPVVIGTNGSMYGVILPENKKYVLTKSSFKELSITGNDLYINNYPSLNLHKIIQVDNDILSTLSDTTNTEIGLLHTKDTGEISISKLTNEDISVNAITTDKIANNAIIDSKIANNAITGNKLLFNNLQTINNWSNIIIDTNGNLYNKHGDFFTNSNKFGVFNWQGDIQSLCANIITEGTMNGDRISEETLQYNRLKISTDPQTSNWSIIAVNSNNNFIKFSNTLSLNNQYGVFDYNGNIVQLTTDKISGTINSNMIENGSIGSIKLGTSSVTTVKIDNNAVTGDKIAPEAVGETQIANNSITSSKLNINGSEPLGTWKNLLINDNKFVTTDARVTNYGIFNNKGGVQELTGELLNDIGFNVGIPDGEENEFNQIFVSANCIFYTSTIKDNYVNTNYINICNYFNSNNSSNKIIYINNPDQFADTYNNIKNTYNTFYNISNNSNISDINDYSIKLKTSLYIKNIEFDLRNITDYFHKENDTFNPLVNSFFQSSILMVGVYTSLCKLETPTQVIMLPDKLFRYIDNSNYCESALLGYIPIDVSTVNVNSLNNIIIDKTFDFESTVNKGNIKYNNLFDNIKDDLLYFVPMYYINNNDNTIKELTYYDYTKNSSHASKIYENIFLDNNGLTITYSNTKTNSSNIFTIPIDDITVTLDGYGIEIPYATYFISWSDNIYYVCTPDNVIIPSEISNMSEIIGKDTMRGKLIFNFFINKPIEKNIKINLSPITNRSNIIYTTSLNSDNRNELNKEIKYKFSLCSVNLSFTKNIGQYPAIIQ